MTTETYVPDPLTVQILATLATGCSTAVAARHCHVSQRTVERKLAEVRAGWGTTTIIHSVATAVRRGLV